MNTKLNKSPYHSPHHTPAYSAQMNRGRVTNPRIRRSRSNTNINNRNQMVYDHEMVNVDTHYYHPRSRDSRHTQSSGCLHHEQHYTTPSYTNGPNYEQTNAAHTNTKNIKKYRLNTTGYPFASINNRKSSKSKSISSVSSNNSAETTNTSVYTSTTCISSPRSTSLDGPCDGDPFWDYYRTIGNISRANSFELINVMKFISAEHIIKFFLQNWVSSRIEPIDLPFAHNAISNKMQYTKRKRKLIFNPSNRIKSTKSFTMSETGQYKFDLTAIKGDEEEEEEEDDSTDEDEGFSAANGVIFSHKIYNVDSDEGTVNESFVYSSIAKEGNDAEHDINVNSSSLTKFIRHSLKVSDASAKHPDYFNIPSITSKLNRSNNAKWKEYLNDIGSNILSFCDQESFLNALIVSRSWFYCSRFETSRSHIKLRLKNVLKYLMKPQDLLAGITQNNDIICIDKNNENDSDDEVETDDILLSCNTNDNTNDNTNNNGRKTYSFPYFFSSRSECNLFSCISVLEMDLTVLSSNSLMYFMDDTLYDCYWEMALTLFRIESLTSISLILCDPHILLLSYILKNINNLMINKSELKFPSIGIPKNKFLCISSHIKSLSFKCKTLSTHSLIGILNTHFEHYYHPSHHNKRMNNDYIEQQSTSFCYKSLDSYILCRKTIQKPLIFDITHALYYLNRRPSDDIETVERLILCDVRCSSYEFEIFLNHNSNALLELEIQFTKYCVFDRSNRSNNTPPSNSRDRPSPQSQDEDTGFPDIPYNNNILRSSTMLRITGYLNEIFSAICEYLRKSVYKIRKYRNIKTLPLNTLAVSFPNSIDDECIGGFADLFAVFESQCDEINLTKLYLNGVHLRKLNWINIWKSQPIQTFYLRQIIYFESFFDNLSKLCSYSLLHVDLSLSFDSNNNNINPIKRLFLSLSKCHRLQDISLEFRQKACYNTRVLRQYSGFEDNTSNSYSKHSKSQSKSKNRMRGTPLPQLPQPLPSTPSTDLSISAESISMSSHSHSHSHHLMEPILDVWWIHQFITSKNIKKSIKTLKLIFNELTTSSFESNTSSTPKYTRWHQAHGQILRISDTFRVAVEQLIMSWFAHCPHLIEAKMLRKLSTMDTFDTFNDIYNDIKSCDNNNNQKINFDLDISCFNNDLNQNDIHDLILFKIKKWKVDNVYKGDVCGELDKLLMPEIPIA